MEDGVLFCPTHPTALDPALLIANTPRDVRTMANMYVFKGLAGPIMTAAGAFPVNREKGDKGTITHSEDVLREGKALCIFPEGNTEPGDQVTPIKKGAAIIGLNAAEKIVPVGVHYSAAKPTEGISPWWVALASAGAAYAAGPTAGAALGLAMTAAVLGGKYAYAKTPDPGPHNPINQYGAALGGGAAGAVAGGIVGALLARYVPSSLSWGLAAFGGYKMQEALNNRQIATLRYEKPIGLEPYRAMPDRRAAVDKLTEDLHRALGQSKAALSGVPYDESAPKFRGKIIETLKD